MATHIKTFLANQLRAFRGSMSQGEFGQKIGKPQPVVNRNENASYGKFTLQNLLDIAEKLDVAVHVRFVDFQRFIELTEDLSEKALKPMPYHQASSGVSLEVDSGNIVVTPAAAQLTLNTYAPTVIVSPVQTWAGVAGPAKVMESGTALSTGRLYDVAYNNSYQVGLGNRQIDNLVKTAAKQDLAKVA